MNMAVMANAIQYRRRFPVFILRVSVFLLLLSNVVLGQGYASTLAGTVTGPTGIPIVGAQVSATREDTGHTLSTTTALDGRFAFPGLVPSRYNVQLSAKGFDPLTMPNVTLETSQIVNIDVTLKIGATREKVTVTEDAGVIETETAQLSQTITTREIVDIPLNGRNYLTLNLLTPGTVPSAAGTNPHNMNGARADHVGYLLDGIGNLQRRSNEQTSQPSLEAVQEFRALTNSYAAEYGRMPGLISVALKSGANTLHASVFQFLRNDAMDARGFFDAQTPKLKRNQFGAMFSGAIRPNRTFFLASYEALRSRAAETHLARVPTFAERSGNIGGSLRDPITGAVYANGILTADRIDPVAQNLLNYVPLPNRAGTLNYFSSASIHNDWDTGTAKIDHILTGRDRLSVQLVTGGPRGTSPYRASDLPGYGTTNNGTNIHAGISWNRTFTPNTLNELRIGFNRTRFTETSVNAGLSLAQAAGIAGAAPGSGLTNIVITGYTTFGDPVSLPANWTENNYSASDTFTWSRGNHTIKFGGLVQRNQYFELFGAYTMGQLVFRNAGSGSSMADFLLGLPQQAQRQIGTNTAYLFSTALGAFVQDDWRIHPRITVNLGLRYDVAPPPYEKYNRWANFIPSLGRSVLSGDPNFPRALVRTDRNDFSPRFGLAWRVDRESHTVLRAGYGIFYGSEIQFQTYQLLGATAFPFTQLQILQSSAGRLLRISDPFSISTGTNPAALSPNGVDVSNPSPYTQNWNLTLSHEFGSAIGIDLAYVGSHSLHQSVALNINQQIRSAQGATAPYPGFSRIIYFTPSGNANYNGLQISARRRLARGLSFRSSFTWSKSIDNASFGTAARQPQNSRDLASERGLSDFNRARTWVTDFVYDLPIRGRGIGGWQLSAIVLAYDGRPFTPTQTGTNQNGEPTRPDRIRTGDSPNPTTDQWFDPTAFRRVPLTEFRYGNSGRNILTGPGKLTLDTAISKSFAITETHRVLFRAEFFNVPNRANFGDPITLVDQPTAGAISTADPGRQIQLGLKYTF